MEKNLINAKKIDVDRFEIDLIFEWAEKTNALSGLYETYSKELEAWEHGADNDELLKELRGKMEPLEDDVAKQNAIVATRFARLIGFKFNEVNKLYEYEQNPENEEG